MQKKYQALLIFFCGISHSIGIHAALPPAQKIQELFGSITTMHALFEQKITNAKGIVLQELSGIVYLKKPNLLHWEVITPDSRLTIIDGKKIWNYDADLAQVTVKKIGKDLTATPLYFLTNTPKNIENYFAVSILETDKVKKVCLDDSILCFTLIPKDKEAPFQVLTIGFDNKNHMKQLVLLDQLGQYSYFTFKQQTVNQPIEKKKFVFLPPKQVDVIEE